MAKLRANRETTETLCEFRFGNFACRRAIRQLPLSGTVRDVQATFAKCGRHCLGHFGLCQHDLRSVFSNLGSHRLLARNRFGSSDFGLGPSHARVGFCLVSLQSSTDVLAYVDVGNVDGDDFERRMGVQAPLPTRPLRFGLDFPIQPSGWLPTRSM